MTSSRRHSVYIESAAREEAIRSAAWSSAWQIRHHSRMSASDGAVLTCSIREHFDSCQPAASASARAVEPGVQPDLPEPLRERGPRLAHAR